RPAGVNLPPHLAERALDRRVDVLVLLGDRRQVEAGEDLLDLGQLVTREQPGGVQTRRMPQRPFAVVREQLRVVRAKELPHLGGEAAFDPAGPQRHAWTLRLLT